jgi:hypothetical protein
MYIYYYYEFRAMDVVHKLGTETWSQTICVLYTYSYFILRRAIFVYSLSLSFAYIRTHIYTHQRTHKYT